MESLLRPRNVSSISQRLYALDPFFYERSRSRLLYKAVGTLDVAL
jgi:hypothetical protein